MERLSLKQVQDPRRIIEDFCKDCKLRGMTYESIRRYKSSLLIFASFLLNRGVNIDDVDAYMLKDFLQHIMYERNVKHKTAENYFSALSAFYDYLVFEGLTIANIILPFRKRYLRRYKDGYDDPERKLLSVEEMGRLVNSIMDPRDKAIAVLFAKTGIRRGELLKLDVDDVNWEDYSITLKPTPKRSNRVVFFDDECAVVLRRWLGVREKLNPKTKALFVSYQNLNRFDRNGLYTAIVKYINLTFTYAFTCNPEPENILVEHQTTIQVESPGRWPPRTLQPAEAEEMFQLSGNLNWTMQINGTKIRQFVEAIDKEIYGTTRSTNYNININIKPKIHVTAKVTTQAIDETFTPELTMAFKTDAEKGNYITIENLNQAKPGRITETQQIPLPHIQFQRTASYIATATTTIALAISAFLYIRYKPAPPPTKVIEKLTAPYKELIAKTTQKPPETKTTIETETLEDLAKIAEILARPILHTTEAKEHTFYIIDNNTKYQHKTKA